MALLTMRRTNLENPVLLRCKSRHRDEVTKMSDTINNPNAKQ